MLHEEKKLTKIVEELTIFFLGVGATDLTSQIAIVNKEVIIHFSSDFDPKYEKQMDDVKKLLNEQKDEAMEDFYWELVGSGDPGETSQLLMIGVMIEEAEVVKNENRMDITIKKKLAK